MSEQPTMQIPPLGGVHAKVEKGMAGKYGWSLSITLARTAVHYDVLGQPMVDDRALFAAAIDELQVADGVMRRMFGTEPAP